VKREPIFNIPPVIVAVAALLIIVHVVQTWLLTDEQRDLFFYLFAFIPARYESTPLPDGLMPGGFAADIWTFVTYSFIHGGWAHLGINLVWLLPFGTAVARRFGTARFLAFYAVTAAGGALAHLIVHGDDNTIVIGASAAISGTMAAAMRFAFQRGGPLGLLRGEDDEAYRVPAIPLTGLLRDARVLIFLVVWFGLNILFGFGSLSISGGDQPVAWQAHIGGFLAGLLLFSWFDPAPETPQFDDTAATRH
jgi:membrane associated rhomboid family serine protease